MRFAILKGFVVTVALGMGLAAVSSGCTARTGPGNETGQTSSTSEALGENACTTVSISNSTDGAAVNYNEGACGGGWAFSYSTSPDGSYDNGSTCPYQYVVEVDSVNHNNTITDYLALAWNGVTLNTATKCSDAHVYGKMWGYACIWNYGCDWYSIGQAYEHGVWTGSSCVFAYDTGSGNVYTQGVLAYGKYRIAAQATENGTDQSIAAGVASYNPNSC